MSKHPMGCKFTRYCSCDLSIELLTSLQKCYWLHYKVLLISLQTQLLTLLQKCYWLHYKSVTDFITKCYWLHYKNVTDFITNSITDFITKVLLTSLQECYWLHYKLNYWLHYNSVTDFITNSITDFITKELLTSLPTQLLTSLQKCYWLHYKLNYWLHYKLNYWPHYKSITNFITDWLCCKVIITNANNVLNGHSNTYFSPPAGLILFLKVIPDRMSPINIIEGLGTISPIKICWECDGCARLHLDDMHWWIIT